jgi:2-hydroxychromene-2-carboxylate isomerase
MHPIALGALFRDLGTANVPLFDFVPAKRRYIELDMQRWARWWGVPLAMPAKFPQRTLTAQRLSLVARARGAPVDAQIALARALGAAMWADGRDLEDDATLASVLAAQQLPADWLAATREPAIKELLARETADARAAGVFGVPSFRVGDAATGDALIWGQDRLDLVAHALATEPAP